MEQIDNYLKNGSQTEPSENIRNTAVNFKSVGLNLIFEILEWLKKNLKETKSTEEKNKLFRRRTAEEIIRSGMVTGCTDYALAFIALTRAKGIPTKYVEAIRNRWLDVGDEGFIEGHVFAECFINGKWYVIDPQEGDIKTGYQRFRVFKKGLDSWDIGIKSFDDLKKHFLEFKKNYKA
jgi:predicted transglutaminase-like protease